jgi:hypothetical protein
MLFDFHPLQQLQIGNMFLLQFAGHYLNALKSVLAFFVLCVSAASLFNVKDT